MDTQKKHKIAIILYTAGLEYDDRIRKEIQSLMALEERLYFKIFALLPENREATGKTSYGVDYRTPHLSVRNILPSGKFGFIKLLCFYLSIRKELKGFDTIWCADPEMFFFVLLVRQNSIVWDLHEYPVFFAASKLRRWFFRKLTEKCSVMIHANAPRLNYLDKLGMLDRSSSQLVLHNYPRFNEIDKSHDDVYEKFVEWLDGKKCVYLQGIVSASRADIESLEAVLSFKDFKIAVIGKIRPEVVKYLNNKYGKKQISNRIYFTGQINQLKTPQYIRLCSFSLIFYKKHSINNWLCEPNRLYQNVINGNPVVVGNNPTMKHFVNNYQCGVVANTDGSNISAIIESIHILLSKYDYYSHNASLLKEQILWDKQIETLGYIKNHLFNN